MGCDIHAIIERREVWKDHEGKEYMRRWRNAGEPRLERNYEVFAALADVRNRTGIAPIAPPRGLPGVVGIDDGEFTGDFDEHPCSVFEAYYLSWKYDAHSASWLTLAEIKAYNTEQVVDDHRKIVKRNPESGQVLATAAWTSVPGPHELVGRRRIFTWPGDDPDQPTPWGELIEDMERAKRPGDTDEDVRLVFFFDN
jgi:hypothetical protein